jgi:hypothetical protein
VKSKPKKSRAVAAKRSAKPRTVARAKPTSRPAKVKSKAAGRPTPERLMQLMWGYAAPLVLETAVRLRIFDKLEAGPKTADDLAAASGASVRGLRIILNALVGLEFLSTDSHGRYANSAESSAFLVSSRPVFFGGMLQHTSSHLLPKWLQLNEIVRTGSPATAVNRQMAGAAFFEQFVEDLYPFNLRSAEVLADALKIAAARAPVSVLDLAAGSGVWGITLAKASPQVQVTAVDWPGVIEVTQKVAAKQGVAERFRFVPGDLQDADFGTGHQIAALGHILHSEGEERSRALLKKTFAALAPGGTIAIAEFLVNDNRTGPPNALIFAVNMLVNTDVGDTFSFREIKGWLEEAGFDKVRTVESPGPSPLILANRPK